MPHPLSNDLRERIVTYVKAGHSCHEAAAHFDTSVSFAVNLKLLLSYTASFGWSIARNPLSLRSEPRTPFCRS
jgi:hypothetical protein